MEKECTDERIEHLKHQDFKNSKHLNNCDCGYCWMKKNQIPIASRARR